MGKPIFVAGHRGLVGSAILRALQARGMDNIIVRTRADVDLTNQQAVAEFFEKERPEYVFLAAARVGGIMANSSYRGEFIYQNLMIQNNVMHQAMLCDVKRLLFLGSTCIYPKHAPQPMREEHLLTGPLEPTNSPYAVAKIAGVEFCDAYNRQYNTSFMPVMPTNLYGPRDNFDLFSSHVLPALMRKLHLAVLASQGRFEDIELDEERFGPIPEDLRAAYGLAPHTRREPVATIWGTGSPMREFMHVDDMADACLYLMFEHDGVELTNIGVGEEISIKSCVEMIAEIVGWEGAVEYDTSKPDGSPRKLTDVSRLSAAGWRAKIDLREGLEKVYNWYLAQTTQPRPS